MRNPKPTYEDKCVICGQPYACTHEIFFGRKNREISQKHGFVVKLCYNHHQRNDKQYRGVHFNKDMDNAFKMMAQREFEETHTREEFRKLIGKSYL